MKLYEILTFLLIVILAITFTGMIFVAIINPEVYLFGKKLAGDEAGIYLLANAFIGVFSMVLILKKNYQIGIILALLYFGYNAYEGYISYQTITPFKILSLVIPILALICLKLEI